MEFNSVIILRSAAERTVELCRKLILDQGVPESQVLIVQEVPFSAAMKRSFRLGIASGLKWTFCIDADVLLRPGSIAYMINEAERQPENVCEIQGLVMDKFFDGPRPAGNHLFRTSLLNELIKKIPVEGVNIRPEFHALNKMKEDGYPWKQISYIVGIHDDEQYNFDIYRKCFVQGVKHLNYADLFVPLWKQNMRSDQDFKIGLKAFSDSISYDGPLYINSKQQIYANGFNQTGFDEKGPIDLSEFSLQRIDQSIRDWKESEFYLARFPGRFGLDDVQQDSSKKKSITNRIRDCIRKKGILASIPYLSGKVLMWTGRRLAGTSSR